MRKPAWTIVFCLCQSSPLTRPAVVTGPTYLSSGLSRHEHSSDCTRVLPLWLAVHTLHGPRVKIYPPCLITFVDKEDARLSSYPSSLDLPLEGRRKHSVDGRLSPNKNFHPRLPFRHVPRRRWMQHSLWREHRHRRCASHTRQQFCGQQHKAR